MKISIGEPKPDQFSAILEFCASLRNDEHPCSFWGLDQSNISEQIHTGKIVATAIDNGLILGIGTIARGGAFQNHWAEISVAVAPSHRKLGVASLLVSNLEAAAKSVDIKMIKALILENNHASRSLFSKSGYIHKATLYAEFNFQDVGLMNDCVYYKDL